MIEPSDIEAALVRASMTWVAEGSHTDDEQAYIDRLWLASEVKRLRREAGDCERELHRAYAELQDCIDERNGGDA